MSKVQKAILKARAARQGKGAIPAGVDGEPSQAAIGGRVVKVFDGADEEPKRSVVVDSDVLREQGLLAPEGQARHVSDQYRIIKRPILKLAMGESADAHASANLVMIASPLSGDGKTFNAINIALSIANENEVSVVLVDADVAKPHITRLFGLADEPGFIDLLRDGETNLELAKVGTSVPGLSIIPAGQVFEYATELLASNRMAEAVRRLSSGVQNRVVVFDSPPLLQATESSVLASRMDQIVLVVCADRTPRPAVFAAIDLLDPDKPLNLIFNRAGYMFGGSSYGGYSYGYGSDVV